jgi:hypothetical protein
MSSFHTFALVAELNKKGYQPLEVSLSMVAKACASLGAKCLAELVGVNMTAEPKMAVIPAGDRLSLQKLVDGMAASIYIYI